ncbi:hypothetical protein D3C81_2095940 [compost metagenome]
MRSFYYVRGGVEVRFTERQVNDVSTRGAHCGGTFGHEQNRRLESAVWRFDIVHGALRNTVGWALRYELET